MLPQPGKKKKGGGKKGEEKKGKKRRGWGKGGEEKGDPLEYRTRLLPANIKCILRIHVPVHVRRKVIDCDMCFRATYGGNRAPSRLLSVKVVTTSLRVSVGTELDNRSIHGEINNLGSYGCRRVEGSSVDIR
jgi:hypothetical protein